MKSIQFRLRVKHSLDSYDSLLLDLTQTRFNTRLLATKLQSLFREFSITKEQSPQLSSQTILHLIVIVVYTQQEHIYYYYI